MAPRKYRITLAYDGANYSGWQFQENALGIQQLVEEALAFVEGGAVGVFAGWLFERHYIRFHTPDTTAKKLIRFLGGMVVLLVIMKGLKPLLNAVLGLSVGSFVRYMLVGLFATMGWPLIFKKAGF